MWAEERGWTQLNLDRFQTLAERSVEKERVWGNCVCKNATVRRGLAALGALDTLWTSP